MNRRRRRGAAAIVVEPPPSLLSHCHLRGAAGPRCCGLATTVTMEPLPLLWSRRRCH